MQKPPPELVKQLRRQLDFIRNSASAYDAGHSEEALRIGVAIRVLLHDTRFSNSLLNQMGQKESLKLITTAKEITYNLVAELDFGECLAGMVIGSSIEYSPVPDGMPTVSCVEWWAQPVFIRDKVVYTRKDVVLSAANKDGGAHVDEPDEKLQALQTAFWTKTQTNADGQTTTIRMEDNHFRMLRRFADDLLLSSELLVLAA